MAGIQTFKSKTFTTDVVPLVWPHLREPDRFGKFSVDVDIMENPDLKDTIEQQMRELVAAAQNALGTDKVPSNSPFRTGESKDGTPFARVGFKKNGTKKVNGKEIAATVPVVDAHRQAMDANLFSGTKAKIAYFIQYTVMPTGACYGSLKLVAVQVIKLVGPGGEVDTDDVFGIEDGHVTQQLPTNEDETEYGIVAAATAPDPAANLPGADF